MKPKAPGSVEVKAGQLIISEGESGREMYIIEDGRVEIVKGLRGEERQLGILETGDFFGEMAILEDLPRGASVRAITDCKLLLIDHSTFDQMLREYPEIAVRMLRKLSARLRMVSTDLQEVPPQATVGAAAISEAPRKQEAAEGTFPQPGAKTSTAGKLVAHPAGAEFPLPEKSEIRIGRFDSVTGLHPDIDLSAIDTNKLTSRRHAKLLRENGKICILEEIGTPNGTFVNGARIATGVKTEIRDGDEIRFADVRTIYRAL